jgi:hypothetical protein
MQVTISSTAEAQAADAALSKKAEATEVEQQNSASSEQQDESNEEESETSENLEDSESDESAESEDDEDTLKDEQDKSQRPKKKGGYQKRIDKLTRERSLAAEEAQYWKEQALKAGKADKQDQPPTQKTEAVAVAESKPLAKDFDTHEDYVEALTDWKIEQKEKQSTEKAKLAEAQAEHQKRQAKFQENIQSFTKATPDFNDVLEEVEHIPLSQTLKDAIVTSDDGARLIYELAKNPTEYERINSLHPAAALRAIGAFEAKLSSEPTKTKEIKTITKAPAPISAIAKGSAPLTKSLSDPNLPFSEYEKLRLKEIKKK